MPPFPVVRWPMAKRVPLEATKLIKKGASAATLGLDRAVFVPLLLVMALPRRKIGKKVTRRTRYPFEFS